MLGIRYTDVDAIELSCYIFGKVIHWKTESQKFIPKSGRSNHVFPWNLRFLSTYDDIANWIKKINEIQIILLEYDIQISHFDQFDC